VATFQLELVWAWSIAEEIGLIWTGRSKREHHRKSFGQSVTVTKNEK
jgi:hypothetical protein